MESGTSLRVQRAERPLSDLRPLEAFTPKVLYAVDGQVGDPDLTTDPEQLAAAARSAVAAGGGHVLDETAVVFPNGAVTLVLVLAESHLSVHTWPEEHLVAVDLFSCGAIDGPAVIDELARRLGLGRVAVRRVERGLAELPTESR
ncbi:MAG TPA: S-adenosylmethionine decarboxylase [Mycobacteriales bacterium]|nr:S-adenosylmethionine decarboxylase [Mycobacteriales bacterium]